MTSIDQAYIVKYNYNTKGASLYGQINFKYKDGVILQQRVREM